MKRLPERLFKFVAASLLIMFASTTAFGQSGPPPAGSAPPPPGSAPPPQAAPWPQDQMDALMAPIALYPDQLVTQVLMASTYPLEVVEAARFVQQNPGLKGQALDDALKDKPWDASVQSLAAFPQVLAMMNDKLDWTQQLGDAFLSNQAQVMDTVQSLRARAQAAGNLRTTPQQKVIVQQQTILIEPAQPDYVYVPVYNPTVIYGPWWAPAYRPWYWYPPSIYGYPAAGGVIAAGIIWGSAWAISANHWGWASPVWGSHNIHINVNNNYFVNRPQYQNRYQNGNWQHMPEHRLGVAYRDPVSRDRYQHYDSRAVDARRDYRGNNAQPTNTGGRPAGASNGNPRPAGGNNGQPSGGGNNLQPRPGGSAGGRPTSPGTDRPMTRPSPNAQTMSRPSPTFNQSSQAINTRDSRPQVQQQSNRGQTSRESSMRPSGGGQPSAGGGGGQPGRGGGGGGGGGRPSGGGGGQRGKER